VSSGFGPKNRTSHAIGKKAESNRLDDDGLMPKTVEFIAWNAGAGVLDPERRVIDGDSESPMNKDFYTNLKAQAWWQLRRRFEKTHRCVSDMTGQTRYDQDELISIPSDLPLLRTLQKELSQPTASKGTRMRLVIDKQPEGTRSPNLADAVVMAYSRSSRKCLKIITVFRSLKTSVLKSRSVRSVVPFEALDQPSGALCILASPVVTHTFDPTAEETVFFPRLVGG